MSQISFHLAVAPYFEVYRFDDRATKEIQEHTLHQEKQQSATKEEET
jgi:hypothetical protein